MSRIFVSAFLLLVLSVCFTFSDQSNQENSGVWKQSSIVSQPVVNAPFFASHDGLWVVSTNGISYVFTLDISNEMLIGAQWKIRKTSGNAPKNAKFGASTKWVDPSTSEPYLVMYGGLDSLDNAICSETIHGLNMKTWEWKELGTFSKSPNDECSPVNSSIDMIDDCTVLAFGGHRTKDGKVISGARNDVRGFNLCKNRIEDPTISNPDALKPRLSHASTVWNDKLYILGGFVSMNLLDDLWSLDVKAQKWEKIDYSGDFAARAATSNILLGSEWWIFGGQDDEGMINDLVTLNLSSETISNVKNITKDRPDPQMYAAIAPVVRDSGIHVYSGIQKKVFYQNQTWSFHLLQ